MKEFLEEYFNIWVSVLGIFLIYVVLAIFIAGLRPTFLRMERDAIQNSRQFEAGKIAEIEAKVNEWQALEIKINEVQTSSLTDSEKTNQITGMRGSQRYLYQQILSAAAQLDESQIPDYIKSFIEDHSE